MTTLYSAWASAPLPALASAPRLFLPPHLYMRTLDCDPQVVRVSFYLGRLRVLSRCELEVARWASDGYSNAAIAELRETSIQTVTRQMTCVLSKLGLGARLG